MIIVSINGGLGNQLFQYAFGKNLAFMHNLEVRFDLSVFENPQHVPFALHHFKTNITKAEYKDLPFNVRKSFADFRRIASLLNKTIYPYQMIKENQYHFNPNYLEKKDNAYYWGYWQSEKYFNSIKTQLLEDFSFKDTEMLPAENEVFQRQQSVNAVCLHVRRGDYVGNKHHPLCGLPYYEKATALMAEKVEHPYFFIFSDDIPWCKDNLLLDWPHEFVNTGEAWRDFRLMTHCRHYITANSSFSWWGAYLGRYEKKIVISPSKWFNDQNYNIKDLICEKWLSIS